MHGVKSVIIGLSGGISAYKIPNLIRLFKKNSINVKVVCSPNALNFVTPLTLETLSENKIYSDVFASPNEYSTQHIAVSDSADILIVAPATANTIAKFAYGIADNALTTTYLSFNKEVFIAPAMNTKMLEHPATIENINILKSRGNIIIKPDSGFLACGHTGKGRMPEPESIYNYIKNHFSNSISLINKTVLVTAGPTYEFIDPVRFIGNKSSGKMGYAIAESFAKKGANVFLISGPTNLKTNNPNIETIRVTTAKEMFENCTKIFPKCDIAIKTAAVADYSPSNYQPNKIKKADSEMNIKLVATQDILSHLGKIKKPNQILVGFALESENEIDNAKIKLHNKNLDCIVLNSLKNENSCFDSDLNQVTIINKNQKQINTPLKPKDIIADEIVNFITSSLIKKTR